MPPFRRLVRSALPTLALCIALAGCQPGTSPSSTDGGSTASAPVADRARLSGTAVYRERIVPPPGSRLQVQLIDVLYGTAPEAVLAETEIEDVGPPPIAFSLDYDPASIRANGQYGLHAALYGPEGALLFVADVRHAVAPGRDEPVELSLGRVAQESADAPAIHPADGIGDAVNRRHWQCGELRVDTTFDPATLDTTLSFSGRRLVLAQTATATGTRHADKAGNEFRSEGDRALLTLDGQPQIECTPSDTPSPWTDAADRGIGFRAAGNEPGWWVEVGMGEAPTIEAVLDYGERSLEVEHAQPDELGYTGITADGERVTLVIDRTPCEDGMSGEAFEASARLEVDGRRYSGCGAFLFD
ncbi:YbaY family lipoprotein [Marilutibacter chinensis]|uniref:YbaY family lipoprotein n=1 Tax=Marilutibacter chinensis TaxID=2912247 RepID=A0ABS9HPS9_9GAMM|nr:YbaY family lipoprotein [Lysobacter chinensis]MCF7220643.1 YbaY family lipoprotein [Lysobacter chinensis]